MCIRTLALAGLLVSPQGASALDTAESAATSIGRPFDKTGSFPAPPVAVGEYTFTTPDTKRSAPSLVVRDIAPGSRRTPPPPPAPAEARKGFGSHMWKAIRFPFVGIAGGAAVGAAYGAGKGYSLVKGTRGVSKVTGVLGGIVGLVVGAVGGLLAGLWGAIKSTKDAVVDLFHGEL